MYSVIEKILVSLITSSICMIVSTTTFGQDSISLKRSIKEAAAMKADLALTEVQHIKLLSVLGTFYRQMDGIRKVNDSTGVRKTQMKGVYAEREKGIRGILDKVQLTKYLDHMERRKTKLLNEPVLKAVKKSFITE